MLVRAGGGGGAAAWRNRTWFSCIEEIGGGIGLDGGKEPNRPPCSAIKIVEHLDARRRFRKFASRRSHAWSLRRTWPEGSTST